METYDVTLIALDIRKWDLESLRLYITTYVVLDDEEKVQQLELAITQPPEMVEEFLGKVRVGCEQKMRKELGPEAEFQIVLANETFLRQKLYNYFRRILMELNNPKRRKGQPKMIFTTHMDVYNENQDISFLPIVIQFYVVLNWARKYYDKEDYQRAVEPLRKLIQIKPDFGLSYKWLARSLKKIRKYDEAIKYYEKYAEVEGNLESKLDLAQSYRKGKLFDKAEAIYQEILKEDPKNKEARIGLAQIRYAQNNPEFMSMLEELYQEDPEWLKKWLKEEFNFRIYISQKTPLQPLQASRYLGYEKVFEMTQKAFRNEIPSHFNPNLAKMSFYKEELDNWAMVMNHFQVFPEPIQLHPETLPLEELKPVEVTLEEEEQVKEEEGVEAPPEKAPEPPKPTGKHSTRVEEILKKLRAARAAKASGKSEMAALVEQDAIRAQKLASGDTVEEDQPVKRRRGRPPKKKVEEANTTTEEGEATPPKRKRGRPPKVKTEEAVAEVEETPKRRRGRPPKKKTEEETEAVAEGEVAPKRKRGRPPKVKTEETTEATDEAPKKRRGRPPKKKVEENSEATQADSSEEKPKKKRGRPPKNKNNETDDSSVEVDIPNESEFLIKVKE